MPSISPSWHSCVAMPREMRPFNRLLVLLLVAPAFAAAGTGASPVTDAESTYADLNDANSVVGAIDSGLFAKFLGRDRAAWEQEYRATRQRLAEQLTAIPNGELTEAEARVVKVLREKLDAFAAVPSPETSTTGRCEDAQRKDLDYTALGSALVGCFTEIANNLSFENGAIDRASALSQLHQIVEEDRRKALFHAFVPLWQAINGSNAADSPYRRLIAMSAANARTKGSPIDEAGRTVGASGAELEQWLVRILEQWRQVNDERMVEPWNYRFETGEADRALAAKIPLDSILTIDHRFYRDLGVDLDALGVLYDLQPRPDKSSVAYTDFLIHGRMLEGRWQPTIARVLASYRHGTLGALNELVHENGHAAHISAIRNRPAYVDWNDTLFVEAFADVPSWSLYEPSWQRRYLGAAAPTRASLRALYGSVMLDVAWALFECRMLRDPTADPNALWTEITSHYLRIVPHPELAWWAVRVQLVDEPGYMVNYGLGAVVTADIRERVREEIGPFDTGNPRWYPWLSASLLRHGSEHDTPALLHEFLGRRVSPESLLTQIRRLGELAREH